MLLMAYLFSQGLGQDDVDGAAVLSVSLFAAIWLSNLAMALWDWWAVGTVARIRDEEINRLKKQVDLGC